MAVYNQSSQFIQIASQPERTQMKMRATSNGFQQKKQAQGRTPAAVNNYLSANLSSNQRSTPFQQKQSKRVTQSVLDDNDSYNDDDKEDHQHQQQYYQAERTVVSDQHHQSKPTQQLRQQSIDNDRTSPSGSNKHQHSVSKSVKQTASPLSHHTQKGQRQEAENDSEEDEYADDFVEQNTKAKKSSKMSMTPSVPQ